MLILNVLLFSKLWRFFVHILLIIPQKQHVRVTAALLYCLNIQSAPSAWWKYTVCLTIKQPRYFNELKEWSFFYLCKKELKTKLFKHIHVLIVCVSYFFQKNIICITSENMIKPMASLNKLFITFG